MSVHDHALIAPIAAPHTLQVVAYGVPAPQGSKRHVGKGILIDHNPAGLGTWRDDVKYAAIRAMESHRGWERDYPAVVGFFAFTLARPKHHHIGGDPARQLRENAPHLHTTRPDLDKLLRSTWDALTSAGVWADDCRLADCAATKTYATPNVPGALDVPGVRIVLHGTHR